MRSKRFSATVSFLAFALVAAVPAGAVGGNDEGRAALVAPRHAVATDGGPADRECKSVLDGRYDVGATEVSCEKARKIAGRALTKKPTKGWKCTLLLGDGHCHGYPDRKRIVHFAVNKQH